HTGGAQLLQPVFIHFSGIFDRDAQTGNAGVQAFDVVAASKGIEDVVSEIVAFGGAAFRRFLLLFVFTAGGFQVPFADGKSEPEVIDHREDEADRDDQQRVGVLFKEEDVVDHAAGEGEP